VCITLKLEGLAPEGTAVVDLCTSLLLDGFDHLTCRSAIVIVTGSSPSLSKCCLQPQSLGRGHGIISRFGFTPLGFSPSNPVEKGDSILHGGSHDHRHAWFPATTIYGPRNSRLTIHSLDGTHIPTFQDHFRPWDLGYASLSEVWPVALSRCS
jgi:hypothetical protein